MASRVAQPDFGVRGRGGSLPPESRCSKEYRFRGAGRPRQPIDARSGTEDQGIRNVRGVARHRGAWSGSWGVTSRCHPWLPAPAQEARRSTVPHPGHARFGPGWRNGWHPHRLMNASLHATRGSPWGATCCNPSGASRNVPMCGEVRMGSAPGRRSGATGQSCQSPIWHCSPSSWPAMRPAPASMQLILW